MEISVLISLISPGLIVTSSALNKSNPADPSVALIGTLALSLSLLIYSFEVCGTALLLSSISSVSACADCDRVP